MRRAIVLAMALIFCATDAFAAPRARAKPKGNNGPNAHALEQQISGRAKTMGLLPVEYHEMYGPYKLWAWVERGKAVNFEARFIRVRDGIVVVGIDGPTTTATKTKQMNIYGFPLAKLPRPQQVALQEEVAKRAKDEKARKVTYPNPNGSSAAKTEDSELPDKAKKSGKSGPKKS